MNKLLQKVLDRVQKSFPKHSFTEDEITEYMNYASVLDAITTELETVIEMKIVSGEKNV